MRSSPDRHGPCRTVDPPRPCDIAIPYPCNGRHPRFLPTTRPGAADFHPWLDRAKAAVSAPHRTEPRRKGQIRPTSRSARKRPARVGVHCVRPMTPEAAASLRIHDDEFVDVVAPRVHGLAEAIPEASPVERLVSAPLDRSRSAGLLWRESLHRRLLGIADVTAAALAAGLVLGAFYQRRAALSALVGAALVLFVFKVAGLYDRDDLRLVHSTLDDVPLLVQLTGLFALGVAIFQNFVLQRTVSANQIAALWVVSFGAIVGARMLARAVAARSLPDERCLVIGERGRAYRIREKLAASRARALVVASLPLEGGDIENVGWVDTPDIIRGLVRDLNVHRIIIAPTTTDDDGGRRPDPRRQGGRGPSQRAAADVRGRRLRGRIRRRRRDDDARRQPLRSSRALSAAQAHVRPRRRVDRALVVVSPIIAAIALAIRLDSAGRSSSARSASDATASTSGSSSSARWSTDAEAQQGWPAGAQRGRRGPVQDHRRPARDTGRTVSARARRWTSCRSCSTCCAAR